MNGRRATARGIVALGILAALRNAGAQPASKVYRLGRLTSGSPTPDSDAREAALRQGLRERGYVDGLNLVTEHRYAEGSAARLPELVAELVRLQVDVLVAGGADAIRAAQNATRSIPIVMAGSADPVQEGFVASLAHPGGNITGLSFLGVDLPAKRLQLLKEAVPRSTRVAVMWNPTGPGDASRQIMLRSLAEAAHVLRLDMHVVEVRGAEELDIAFAALAHASVHALLVMEDARVLAVALGRRLAELAAESRLPAMYSWREHVDAGGLMAYGPNLLDTYRRAAMYVDAILKGARPADLPVDQAAKFEFVINLKTAQALGLVLPPAIIARADEVIE